MIVCIDMGATEIKVAPITENENGILVGKVERFPTNASLGKEGIVKALRDAISSLCDADTQGVAIASAGDIDTNTSVITYATENLPGMIGFDFAEFCRREFGLPTKAINDAHAALLHDIAALYDFAYVMDMASYAPVQDDEYRRNFYLGGHLNASGYLLTSRMVAAYMDFIIRNHPEDFAQVGFIGGDVHYVGAKW